MLEINDELMTPGCPQCAVKHLSAALSYAADAKSLGFLHPGTESLLLMAKAYINLGEVAVGYKSHLWYAVGLLQRAEEAAVRTGEVGTAEASREARLGLEEGGEEYLRTAMELLYPRLAHCPRALELAHFAEASRELPEWTGWTGDYASDIGRIRDDFFTAMKEAPAASEETAEKGGEEAMATKKAAKKAPAFLKKGDPKAKQAACKGGKCKGGKCRG